MRLGGVGLAGLAKNAGAVGIGIIAPTMILKSPGIPAGLMDSTPKRILAKGAIGYLVSMAGRKFVDRNFGNMILIGVMANILMADLLPGVAPATGMHLSEGYQDLPMLSGPEEGDHYRRQIAMLSEISGGGTYDGQHENLNEFVSANG